MKTKISSLINDHVTVAQTVHTLADEIEKAVNIILDALRYRNTIFWMGNGGSAADSQHMAAEFVGRFNRERHPLPSIALTTDTSILTAVGNDYGYDQIFSRQIMGLCKPGDVVIGISTSGNSQNVINAIDAAKDIGAHTIGLLGNNGGAMFSKVDVPILVPSNNTARIQECHILIEHIICEIVDQ